MTWRVCESRYIGLRGGYRVEEKIFRRILWMIALHVCGLDWILEYYENIGGPVLVVVSDFLRCLIIAIWKLELKK